MKSDQVRVDQNPQQLSIDNWFKWFSILLKIVNDTRSLKRFFFYVNKNFLQPFIKNIDHFSMARYVYIF